MAVPGRQMKALLCSGQHDLLVPQTHWTRRHSPDIDFPGHLVPATARASYGRWAPGKRHNSMSRKAASMTRNSLDNGWTAALHEKKWMDRRQEGLQSSPSWEYGHGADGLFIHSLLMWGPSSSTEGTPTSFGYTAPIPTCPLRG